jgi:hypothetical protein
MNNTFILTCEWCFKNLLFTFAPVLNLPPNPLKGVLKGSGIKFHIRGIQGPGPLLLRYH